MDEIADINPSSNIPNTFYYIDLESVTSGRLASLKIFEKGDAPSRAQRLVLQDDILFQTVRPYQQNNYLASEKFDLPTVASTGYAQIRTNLNSQFLYSLLHTNRFLQEVLLRCTGSNYPAINSNDLKEIAVYYPSCGEQDKIALFMALINRRIEKQRQLVEALKSYKRGLLFSVLTEKITLTDDEWVTHKIGDFLSPKSIKQLPSKEAPLMAFTATGGVCEKGERYDRGFLVKDESTKLYKRTDYGDFIYSSNNLDVGSIGLNLYGSAVISDVYEVFSIEQADRWFISEAIKQKKILNDILKYRQGCLYGQYRIYAEDFLTVKIKVPSISMQKKIGSLFSGFDRKIGTAQGILEQLERLKTSLLQQLFI